MITKPYKVALELKGADGGLIPFLGAVAVAKVDVLIEGGSSRVQGTIEAATSDGKAVVLPGVKLPDKFGPYDAGHLLIGDSGTATIETRAGRLTVGWLKAKGLIVHLTVTVQSGGVAALLFNSARLEGAARAIPVEALPVPAPIPVPPVVAPVQPPAPVPEPPSVSGDAIDISGATLLGPHRVKGNPAKARVTVNLKSAKMENGKMWLEYGSVPNWPNADGEPGCSGRNYIFWKAGDVLRGGHWEWQTNGRRDRGLKNIYNGYLGEVPPKHAPCWTVTVRNNMSERSNVVACGAWPG